MSVDEDSKRSEGVKCLICSKETSHRESSRPGQKCATPEAAQALSDLFQNFAQHMNWNTSDHEFDFCHDPFPFCRSCKELVAEMGHLDNQMGTLLRRMKRITIVAASKIMLSTRDGVDGDESNPAREDEVSYFDEKKRKRLKYSPVEESSVPRLSYRQNLWKDFDEIAETSKSTNNVCSNLKSKAVMLHHSESEQMNINTVPEFLLGASVVPWSNQKTNGEHVKKKIDERKADCEPGAVKSERKKINQCVKCKRNFSSPGSLSRHQVISCGEFG
ncbi:unnamed protein product [Allacma fusca]|uniref:C2H2-type domain-containing protein n=1 Tax=Allacma fusca TaxID=39272 RepID=A0A8J2P2E2_9HEXA|nr:unnamed protein product [Allacma fusca]